MSCRAIPDRCCAPDGAGSGWRDDFGDSSWHAVKLGIIGAGSLGSALGDRFAEVGHEIMFGGGASAQDAARRLRARLGSNAETAAFGDVVILAVPFAAVAVALADAGPL